MRIEAERIASKLTVGETREKEGVQGFAGPCLSKINWVAATAHLESEVQDKKSSQELSVGCLNLSPGSQPFIFAGRRSGWDYRHGMIWWPTEYLSLK